MLTEKIKQALSLLSTPLIVASMEELGFKELLITKLNNSKEYIDLLDELVRIKLGYSANGEVVISNR